MSEFVGDSGGFTLPSLSSIGNFLSILAGGQPALKLGDLTLLPMETPEKASFGGKQQLIVHKLPGGQRVIDALGRDDLDIAFGGILEGPLAISRALALDQLRIQGQPQPLSWDTLSWTVIVAEFTAEYTHTNWIPYTIRCIVVQDNSAQSSGKLGGLLGLLPDSVQSDITSALQTVMPIASTVSQALGVAQTALGVVGAFTRGSAAWNTALVALQGGISAANDVQAVASGALGGVANGISGIAGLLGTAKASVAALNLVKFTGAAGNLAGALTQGGYIGRATTNLAGASS